MAQSPWCESYRIGMRNHLIPLDQPTCTFFVVAVSQWINQFCKTNLAIFFIRIALRSGQSQNCGKQIQYCDLLGKGSIAYPWQLVTLVGWRAVEHL